MRRIPAYHLSLIALTCVVAACGGTTAAGQTSVAGPSQGAGQTQPSADAPPSGLVDIGAGLQGPAGLSATVYATGLANVAAFAFDTQGRLWVATAAYDASSSDAVYLVAGAGATPLKVIGNLTTPLGLLWIGDELYVSAAGGVQRFGDFDGTAFQNRETVIALPANVGEVNGMVLAPDGRIWLGISAPTDHDPTTNPYSASVVSFEPDGTGLRVDASGIRAPIAFAIDPKTGEILATMDQRDDLEATTPGDWLAAIVPGQAWGFPDCYGQGGSACAGVPAPIVVLDQHAGLAGVAILSGQLAAVAGRKAIVAEWALGKVQAVTLDGDGTSPRGTVAPFLTGIKNPVALAIGPDGALFAGDWSTGTIYRITAPQG